MVTILPKTFYDLTVYTFIGYKIHVTDSVIG
jgi:hypothetical protein